MNSRQWVLFIVGLLFAAMGIVWALQGAGVLQGSVMSNDGRWIAIGSVVAVLGGVAAYRAVLRRA